MNILKRSLLLVSLVLATVVVLAQSVEDAGAKSNEGIGFYKEKAYGEAVASFEAALKIANEVGADADELKGSIEKKLMNAYYKNGLQYKTIGLDAAIASLEKAYALSEQLGDDNMKTKSAINIAKFRSGKGNSFLKKNKLDEAFAEYEIALEIQPTCVNAYYGIGRVYKVKDDMANMVINMDKAIEFGANNPKAAKTVKKVKSFTSKALVNAGINENDKEHGKKAAEYINLSFNYAPGNAKAYHLLAIAYNKIKNWDGAIAAANNAIEIETGDKSEIYLALGQAFEGKGDAVSACKAYKNVTSGPNVDVAKYQIEQVLKCN